RRRPRVPRPRGYAAAPGADVDPAVVRPVHQVGRGEPVDGVDVAVVVVDDVPGGVPGEDVVGGVDVHPVAVHHGVGVGAESVADDGVALPQRLIGAGELDGLEAPLGIKLFPNSPAGGR